MAVARREGVHLLWLLSGPLVSSPFNIGRVMGHDLMRLVCQLSCHCKLFSPCTCIERLPEALKVLPCFVNLQGSASSHFYRSHEIAGRRHWWQRMRICAGVHRSSSKGNKSQFTYPCGVQTKIDGLDLYYR